MYAAAFSAIPETKPVIKVVDDAAVEDRQCRISAKIGDTATGHGVAKVSHHEATVEGQRGLIIEQAGARPVGPAVADCEPLNYDGTAWLNVENAKNSRGSRHREHTRPGAADRNILVDQKLGAVQANRLPIERGSELNRIPVIGCGDRIAKRAGTVVSCGGDGERDCVNALDTHERRAKQQSA